jgi:hypothetical protein
MANRAKKKALRGIAALAAFVFTLTGCGSAPDAAAPDLTGVSSYYVRADGDDGNAGTSEDTPFRTLQRAVAAAAATPVRKITVIGTLAGHTGIERADPTVKKLIKVMSAAGGKEFADIPADQVGVAAVEGSLDGPDPDEILITGKPGAERAVLAPPAGGEDRILTVVSSTVRLEHIEISGLDSGKPLSAVAVAGGTLTLGKGAKVTKNTSAGPAGIHAVRSLVIMRDDAEVSFNKGTRDAGVYLGNGSVMALFDKALITGNRADGGNGGVSLEGSSLIMYGSSAITGNNSGTDGGGITAFPESKNGYISQVTIGDNAVLDGYAVKQAAATSSGYADTRNR